MGASQLAVWKSIDALIDETPVVVLSSVLSIAALQPLSRSMMLTVVTPCTEYFVAQRYMLVAPSLEAVRCMTGSSTSE